MTSVDEIRVTLLTGITDDDARLSDERVPTDGSVNEAKLDGTTSGNADDLVALDGAGAFKTVPADAYATPADVDGVLDTVSIMPVPLAALEAGGACTWGNTGPTTGALLFAAGSIVSGQARIRLPAWQTARWVIWWVTTDAPADEHRYVRWQTRHLDPTGPGEAFPGANLGLATVDRANLLGSTMYEEKWPPFTVDPTRSIRFLLQRRGDVDDYAHTALVMFVGLERVS